MEVMERLCAGTLLDIMNHVFLEGDQLQSAFEVFQKKCTLYNEFLPIALHDGAFS